MGVDSDNTVYVANYPSGTVSVIDDKTQVIAAGVSFDVNPFHAGRILCNNIDSAVPTNQYFFADYQTQCKAQANKGFQFSSWIEKLGGNSSRTINASNVSDSPLNPLFNALGWGQEDRASESYCY